MPWNPNREKQQQKFANLCRIKTTYNTQTALHSIYVDCMKLKRKGYFFLILVSLKHASTEIFRNCAKYTWIYRTEHHDPITIKLFDLSDYDNMDHMTIPYDNS